MSIPIFLSYPKPYDDEQTLFIEEVKSHLIDNSFSPQTLGVNYHDTRAPLLAIREKISECFGLLAIAFKRGYVEKGTGKPESGEEYDMSDKWLTSPYCYIEPSMAFQLDMPVLIFREKQVIEDGILEKGVLGSYMPEFCLDSPHHNYFESEVWNQLFDQWKKKVLKYHKFKNFEKEPIVQRIIGYYSFRSKHMSSEQLYGIFEHIVEQCGGDCHIFSKRIYIDSDFEKLYRTHGHSLESDFITIRKKYFE